MVIFIEAGAAVDMARVTGLERAEEKVFRKALEKARMTAKSPTSTVSVFVVVEYGVLIGEEGCLGSLDDFVVVSGITKREFFSRRAFLSRFIFGGRAMGCEFAHHLEGAFRSAECICNK